MELRAFAHELIHAEDLATKLRPPPADLTDERPGTPLRIERPGRPMSLQIVERARVPVPPAAGMPDPAQRVRILHAFANHELQAAELFAWALLAFPETPRSFRQGCLKILADEQRHLRLYIDRVEALGARFGDHPVSAHFWNKARDIATPLAFVCTMGLTFESANLDFAREHIDAARAIGDDETAHALEIVHHDEVRHVAFAWKWLLRWKDPEQSAWDAYCANVTWPHGPDRARGKQFDALAREQAGLDEAFIAKLAKTQPTRPGGAGR